MTRVSPILYRTYRSTLILKFNIINKKLKLLFFDDHALLLNKKMVRFYGDYRIKPHVSVFGINPANYFKIQPFGFTTQVFLIIILLKMYLQF